MQVMEEDEEIQSAQMIASQSTERLLEWYDELSDKSNSILERLKFIARELAERAHRAKDMKKELLDLYRLQMFQQTKMISNCKNVLQLGDADKQRQKVFTSNLYFMAKIIFRGLWSLNRS
jgi:hypothetical protein